MGGLPGWRKRERGKGCNKGKGAQLPDPAQSSVKGALGSLAGDAQWGSIRHSLLLGSPYTTDTGAIEVNLPVDG